MGHCGLDLRPRALEDVFLDPDRRGPRPPRRGLRDPDVRKTDGFLGRAPARPCDAGETDRPGRLGPVPSRGGHPGRDGLAHRPVLVEHRPIDAQLPGLGPVRVGHEPAIEVLRGARNVRDPRTDEPAGGRLGDGEVLVASAQGFTHRDRGIAIALHSTGSRGRAFKPAPPIDAYSGVRRVAASMEELEVESVEPVDLPVGVDAPEFVLYGGKGGVGKTTMAAATALASAEGGHATVVISTDPAHSLSDTFERPIPSEPTPIAEDRPLFAAEIDPDASMASPEGLGRLVGNEHPLGDLLGGAAMPGADEVVALQQLLTYLEDDRFDRVVIDTAPTGHTLRLLELPEMLDSMMGRLLEWRERLGGMMEGLGNLMGGSDDEPGQLGLTEARQQIEQLRRVLRDPERTDFRIVMVPETMSVAESGRLLDRLGEAEIPVGTIVVNRIMEDPGELVEDPEDAIVAPDLEHCAFCRHRWEVQRTALEESHELFRGRDVKRVPLFAQDVRGERMLHYVARSLA